MLKSGGAVGISTGLTPSGKELQARVASPTASPVEASILVTALGAVFEPMTWRESDQWPL